MTSKYGFSCTQGSWEGWSLRVGQFDGQGKLEGLVAAADALLVWSGGSSDVQIDERRARSVERHELRRQGGTIDLLPEGTAFEEITWRGQPSACISVNFDAPRLHALLGTGAVLAPNSLRLGMTDPHVVDLVQRLQAHALAAQPYGALYTDALSLTLATYVYARYGASEAPQAEPGQATLPIEPLVTFIEEHLGENIGLFDLAALIGYSPDHFARLFKQTFGKTPYQYVLQQRIERAKSLLRDRSRSIADVALQCGFASQAHFQTAFKARTGVTPGTYRKT
jgi:AraC family transcriptional regulator